MTGARRVRSDRPNPTDSRDDRLHVALVVTALHGVAGGAERVLVDVANGLHERGHRVTVLTYQDMNGPSFYPLRYGIEHLDGKKRHADSGGGLPLHVLTSVSKRNRALSVAMWILRYGPKVLRLRRLLRISRPDVAVGFLPSSFPYLHLAATGTGTRTIASLHNVPDRDLGGDPDRWDQNPVDVFLRRRALRVGDANTVLLPSFLEQLDDDMRAKTHVIPNMIHPYEGPLADVRRGDTNTILAVGRLSLAKDHATLVRAWAGIESGFPSWNLRIIGTGLLLDELEELIAELGVERVTIDEPTTEIAVAYRSAKLFAMPSVYEGFGLVTAEAMACGLPVLGFADCEGTNEIVRHGENGILVEPAVNRADSFAAGMRRLIENEGERIRLAAGAPSSVEQFHPGPVLDAWERVIADATRGTT